jgi:hypothetical protein
MKLIRQPNKWSCLPTAFAMAMEVELDWLIKQIGHDGSEILYPDLKDPERRRSFHHQEIIQVALRNDFTVTPLIPNYTLFPGKGENHRLDISVSDDILFELMSRYSGVLVGETYSGLRHAVAWDRHIILDPNGWKYNRDRFIMEVFWAVGRLPT